VIGTPIKMEKELIALIREKGPLTGSQIKNDLDEDSFILWQTCRRSKKLAIKRVGTRYLRLDKRVDGFARLSPSILREFLTYSVIGLAAEPGPVSRKVREIASHIKKVSKDKLDLGYSIISGVRKQIGSAWKDSYQVCFVIAGDIVYNMAHDVPRPEHSTGRLVNGSDIDLIVVLEDKLSEDFRKRLDDSIYQEKYRILTSPSMKEEVDYIVKRLSRVKEQVQFRTFKDMVACKILQEGMLLYGSELLFANIKSLLHEHGVTARLDKLEKQARFFRKNAEKHLLDASPEEVKNESLYLFYTSEETEEFE